MNRWLVANRSLFKAIFSHLDTPISLSQWLLFKHGEWDQLATRWVDPHWYPEGVFNALRYRRDVQAVDLLRKAPLPTTFSRKRAAFAAWNAAETQCYIFNEILGHLDSPHLSASESALRDLLARVRKRVGRWLGPLPADLDGAFGPGTCVEYVGANPTVVDKLWLTPTTTRQAACYFDVLFWRTLWGRTRLVEGLPLPEVSRGNRLTTVPKDGKTDRPISIEPLGNLWLQLGVGKFLKRRLRSIGLPRFGDTERVVFPGLSFSYPDAQSVHRRLAREGWKTGLATIDLSSASDTVSHELVRRILPPDWFDLLNDLRSPLTHLPSGMGSQDSRSNGWFHIEKFSSMGNGFTFELETLVFLGLLSEAFGLTPGVNIWVFGDDIIIPEDKGVAACNLLESVGFWVNRRKSYLSGPFRESCGGNFHSGLDVNPVRLKEEPESIPAIIALHNALHKWGFPSCVTGLVAAMVPLRFRVAGPDKLGDVVLHGRPYRSRDVDGSRWVRALKYKPKTAISLDRWSPQMSVVAALLGIRPRVVRRGTPVVPQLKWTSIS